MWIVISTLAMTALVAFALWYSQRGEGSRTVPGSGNAFNAYYGKNRFSRGESPPCPACVARGCIGAGECRCTCHQAAKTKK